MKPVKRKLIAVTSIAYMPVEIYAVEGMLDNDKAAGRFRPEDGKGIIEIDPDQSKLEQFDTLIHELLHAADTLWSTGLSEHATRELATSLCQALKALKKVTARRSAAPKGKSR